MDGVNNAYNSEFRCDDGKTQNRINGTGGKNGYYTGEFVDFEKQPREGCPVLDIGADMQNP